LLRLRRQGRAPITAHGSSRCYTDDDQKIYDILIIGFEDKKMKIVVDGIQHEILLEVISPKLGKASPQQLANYEISPSGYGIHWPEIDEDISIDGLIGEKK
jgi:hypothetical protein